MFKFVYNTHVAAEVRQAMRVFDKTLQKDEQITAAFIRAHYMGGGSQTVPCFFGRFWKEDTLGKREFWVMPELHEEYCLGVELVIEVKENGVDGETCEHTFPLDLGRAVGEEDLEVVTTRRVYNETKLVASIYYETAKNLAFVLNDGYIPALTSDWMALYRMAKALDIRSGGYSNEHKILQRINSIGISIKTSYTHDVASRFTEQQVLAAIHAAYLEGFTDEHEHEIETFSLARPKDERARPSVFIELPKDVQRSLNIHHIEIPVSDWAIMKTMSFSKD